MKRSFRIGLWCALTGALLIAVALYGFAPAKSSIAARSSRSHGERIVLAGGCFWGVQAVFESLKGVRSAVAGYAGGQARTAHYEVVSTGLTGHAESVEIVYDPSVISLEQLLKVYFQVAHDPTELNRQGPDTGSQYRSEVFHTTDAQRRTVLAYIEGLKRAHVFNAPIVTKVERLEAFFPAENYHQHYVAAHPDQPYVVYNDKPKLVRLRTQFPELLKH